MQPDMTRPASPVDAGPGPLDVIEDAIRAFEARPCEESASQISSAIACLRTVGAEPGNAEAVAAIIRSIGPICAQYPGVLSAASGPVRAVAEAALTSMSGTSGSAAPSSAAPALAIAQSLHVLSLEDVSQVPLRAGDAQALLAVACRAASSADAHSQQSQAALRAIAAASVHLVTTGVVSNMLGVLADVAREPMDASRASLVAHLEKVRASDAGAADGAEATAAAVEALAGLMALSAAASKGHMSLPPWLSRLLGFTQEDALLSTVSQMSELAVASMPLVHARSPVAAAHGAVCVSCARALSSLVLASIYQGRPPSLVTSELRRLLSEAAAVAGPSAATVATANHSPWQWLRALHPRGAAVLACGRWCGIREPTAVDPRGRPAWRVLQEVVDATRRAVLASFDRGLEEPSASAMLTVAAALADVSGEGRSGWEAQAWGALLCSAGAALVRRGCLRCARPLVGILLDALAQVDAPHPPQRDDLAASCVAVAGVVTAHLAWARAWGGAKAVSDARDLLRRTLDVPGAVYLSLHVGGARRGIAVGLAHLAYESLALGGEAVELVASKLLRLMQDTCWDCKFDVSRAPSLSRLLSCGAPRAPVLPLVSGDVVALLPALSLTVGAWLRAGRDAAYDAECPAWCSVAAQAHAVSVLGSEPWTYGEALKALDAPGVSELVRALLSAFLALVLARAERGIEGVAGTYLGLPELCEAAPALVLKPGYQRDEARMDARILLERIVGTANLARAFRGLRAGAPSSVFQNPKVRRAMRSMDPRDVAIMAVVDLVNAGRCVLLQGTSDVPDARILAAGMAQLHLADRSEVPVAEALQEELVGSFCQSLSGAQRSDQAPQGAGWAERLRGAAKIAALLMISQLQDKSSLVAPGEENTTAPPPEHSAVAIVRGAAETMARNTLMRIVNAYPAVLFSQSCLGSLLQMSVDTKRPLTAKGVKKLVQHLPKLVRAGQSPTAQRLLEGWVERSAHFAPAAMEASVHQMLLGYAAGVGVAENAELMRHASRVLELCTAAKRTAASLSGLFSGASSGTASSFTLLNTKAMYLGRARGRLHELSKRLGRDAALERLTREACASAGRGQGDLDALRDDVMLLAALLTLSASEDATSSSLTDATLGLAIQAAVARPMECLRTAVVTSAVVAWSWICSAIPKVAETRVVQEVAAALLASAVARKGMFAWETRGNADEEEEGGGTVLEAVRCQQACVSFLIEHMGIHYQEGTRGAVAVRASVLTMCQDLLPHLANDPRDHSPRPAVTVHARLQIMFLLAESARRAAGDRTPAAALRATVSALRSVCRATALILAEDPAPWCNLWTPTESRLHIAAVLQLASSVTALRDALRAAPAAARAAAKVDEEAAWASEEAEVVEFALELEADRLRLWVEPTGRGLGRVSDDDSIPEVKDAHPTSMSDLGLLFRLKTLPRLGAVAWQLSPKLAVRLLIAHEGRREFTGSILAGISADLRSGCEFLAAVPMAAPVVLRREAELGVSSAEVAELFGRLPPGSLEDAMQMLAEAGARLYVRMYAVRCLEAQDSEAIMFYMPQMVQTLRHEGNPETPDDEKPVTSFLVERSAASDAFAHRIFWLLRSEGTPPEEAFNPEIKRSGWKPPQDSGLWAIADAVRGRIVGAMSPRARQFLDREDGFFGEINGMSGKMKPIPPTMRKAKLSEMIEEANRTYDRDLSASAKLARGGTAGRSETLLYMPLDPHKKVLRAVPGKGNVMPSAAKFPVMVFFETIATRDGRDGRCRPVKPVVPKQLAYIFKVGDDVRQDVLALQVIDLVQKAFQRAGLEANLFPYGAIPTAYEQGIIEVVPDCQSRTALGEVADGGLYDIFMREYGAPGSPAFESARQNFLRSCAGYAVATYLLQAKDRHNGNLLIRKDGSLVHIDFGFILEISPGGNMKFESAGFKLSHDMTQLIDPGRRHKSPEYHQFLDLCVRGYLVARSIAEDIIAVVGLMQHSGLPCFGHGKPMPNLRKRFRLDLSNRQAAQFFKRVVQDAYDKTSTKYYDIIQQLQNGYPH